MLSHLVPGGRQVLAMGVKRCKPVATACHPSGTYAPVLLSTVLVGVPEK